MSTNDIWTCCCGSANTVALSPEKCPVCQHTKCSECKVGKPVASLRGVRGWKDHLLLEEDVDEGSGYEYDVEGQGVSGDCDCDDDKSPTDMRMDDTESGLVIREAEDIVRAEWAVGLRG